MKLIFPYGLNENDDAQPTDAYTGSFNFELELNKKDFAPRRPLDLVDTTDNAADVRGIMQLIARDDTVTTLIQSGDIVYSYDGSTFSTQGTCSSSARLRGTHWSLDDYLMRNGFRVSMGVDTEDKMVGDSLLVKLRQRCHPNDGRNELLPMSLMAKISIEGNEIKVEYSYTLKLIGEEMPECIDHIHRFMANKYGYFNKES